MKRKILALGIIALLVAAACLCLLPRKTDVSQTLHAVKLDDDGNEVGTAEIVIRGHYLDYLFRKDRMDITIKPFDEYSYIGLVRDASSKVKGLVTKWEKVRYYQISIFVEVNERWEYFGGLDFSPDFECWHFTLWGNHDHFVASSNGEYTTAELKEFFGIK